MIEKINQLKSKTTSAEVKVLCETALAGLNSTMYNSMTPEAKYEIEKFSVTKLFEGLSKIQDPEAQKWLERQKRAWAVKNLGVRESITNLSLTEGKDNYALKSTLEYFRESINEGVLEVRLYESFLTAMQSFSYFPKVGNAIKAIEDQVKTYKTDVVITKIVDTMKESKSSYLVPLIEDTIQNYLDDKNPQTQSFVKECLIKFSYDPFIRDIINLVTLDATELQLEHANASCDIEKVYSPILYLGENEAVFAVKGLYYVKKGNVVSRLTEKDSKKLDPTFVSLCEAINNPNVIIDGKSISVYDKTDKAVITEDKISINGKDISNDEFSNSAEIAHWTGKGPLLVLVETLRKNFNEIAEIDFAKRVFLKEDENHAADVFKLRGNVYVATHNSTDGKSTFYRNINPIQAKGIMMDHLHYDISRLFEGLLPEEEKIIEEIEETKKDYRDYIQLLETKMTDFKQNPYGTEMSGQVIEALQEELNEVQNEYKDYLAKAEKYTRPLGEAITITVDVDGKKYTVPIPKEGGEGSVEGGNGEEGGAEVGKEDMDVQPASAVTFDQDQTELLGDTPTIATDTVNLGGDQAEAEADKKEAEEKAKGAEGEEGDDEVKPEGEEGGPEDLEGGEEDEIKIEDKSDSDEEDEEDEDEEKKKESPIEDSTEKKTEVPKKRKVYLKKKKALKEADSAAETAMKVEEEKRMKIEREKRAKDKANNS